MTIAVPAKKRVRFPADAGNITAVMAWITEITNAANDGTLVADALTADETGRAAMETGYFDETKATDAFEAGAITGLLLKAGALAASVQGRALMATGFFTEAKATDAFAAQAITGALLKNATVTDTQLASNAVTTAKITNANVTAAKLEAALCAAPSARSGPGAIAITSPTCLVTTTGTGDALTLADGGFAGQSIDVVCVGDGGTGVITQTTGAKLRADVTTITWTSVGDFCRLVWTGTLWTPTIYHGVTIATS